MALFFLSASPHWRAARRPDSSGHMMRHREVHLSNMPPQPLPFNEASTVKLEFWVKNRPQTQDTSSFRLEVAKPYIRLGASPPYRLLDCLKFILWPSSAESGGRNRQRKFGLMCRRAASPRTAMHLILLGCMVIVTESSIVTGLKDPRFKPGSYGTMVALVPFNIVIEVLALIWCFHVPLTLCSSSPTWMKH